jgi:hypothetical protein
MNRTMVEEILKGLKFCVRYMSLKDILKALKLGVQYSYMFFEPTDKIFLLD